MLSFERYFTAKQSGVNYKKTHINLKTQSETIDMEVEVPEFWSKTATTILASKYLHKGIHKETSLKEALTRIADFIFQKGVEQGYFDIQNGKIFKDELWYILEHQIASFNSPVWFNVGLDKYYDENYLEKFQNIPQNRWYYDYQHNCAQIVYTKDNYKYPQVSACFISSIKDDLGSIYDFIKQEALLFKYGSGNGANFSSLREENAPLSNGGRSSGVMSFLKAIDASASVIKSGGRTRRSAKMVILDIDHPDVIKFINWKKDEEQFGRKLVENFGNKNISNILEHLTGQNANNSVLVTNEFMERAKYGDSKPWKLLSKVNGNYLNSGYTPSQILDLIAEAIWECGDPGLIFYDKVNEYNMLQEFGKIHATNPCGEFIHLDDTSCNLASINLIKFVQNHTFNYHAFEHVIRVMITAQDILVNNASFPSEDICKRTATFRPLGLGFSNLGGMLMFMGIPYDDECAREIASTISWFMTGVAYHQSGILAKTFGSFGGYTFNSTKDIVLGILEKQSKFNDLSVEHRLSSCPYYKHYYTNFGTQEELMKDKGVTIWKEVIQMAKDYGLRNSAVTAIAPCGTIGLLMDCDTLGIEPQYSLFKKKYLEGGGTIEFPSRVASETARRFGFYLTSPEEFERLKNNKEFRVLRPIFKCSIAPDKEDTISPDAHLLMVSAVQPYISMGISKTVNVPNTFTPQEIKDILILAWERGLKAISIYRDGSKITQPLVSTQPTHLTHSLLMGEGDSKPSSHYFINFKGKEEIMKNDKADNTDTNLKTHTYSDAYSKYHATITTKNAGTINTVSDSTIMKYNPPISCYNDNHQHAVRKRLPVQRFGKTQELRIGNTKIFIRTGCYKDGKIGEVFINVKKDGSTLQGLLNCFAVSMSIGLQYGVPLKEYIDAFLFTKFEPSGYVTGYSKIKFATSIVDAIAKYLSYEYQPYEPLSSPDVQLPLNNNDHRSPSTSHQTPSNSFVHNESGLYDNEVGSYNFVRDEIMCNNCGNTAHRNGMCYVCETCGTTSGCS